MEYYILKLYFIEYYFWFLIYLTVVTGVAIGSGRAADEVLFSLGG